MKMLKMMKFVKIILYGCSNAAYVPLLCMVKNVRILKMGGSYDCGVGCVPATKIVKMDKSCGCGVCCVYPNEKGER